MEFWGVEVKPGQTLKVEAFEETVLHLSQASLGEVKKDKGNDSIHLYVKIGDQKLVVGTLSADKCPQLSYDLVFEKEFELSHTWKNGSIYFCGYKSPIAESDDEYADFGDEEEEDEEHPLDLIQNGKSEENKAKVNGAKPDAKKVNVADLKKGKKPQEDDEDESDEDDSEDDESDDDDIMGVEDDSSDEEEDVSSDEEEETPKKGKKRPAESATKTIPGADKKAKLVTPQKTGGDNKKAGGHTATPYPSKGGKTPASGDKSKQTPKSQVSCKACPKTFNSDTAMQSHSKAKHSGGK